MWKMGPEWGVGGQSLRRWEGQAVEGGVSTRDGRQVPAGWRWHPHEGAAWGGMGDPQKWQLGVGYQGLTLSGLLIMVITSR